MGHHAKFHFRVLQLNILSVWKTSEVLGSVNASDSEKQVKCAVLDIYADVGYLPFDVFEDPVGLVRR